MLQLLFIVVLLCVSVSTRAYGANQTSFKANHQHVRSHGHKNFETSVRTYDRDLFHASLNLIDTLKVEIKGFYHVSTTVGHWNEVLEEHLMLMDGKRFSTNLFASKIAEDRKSKKKDIGMKLSTGWSSVLEIADSIELNFDAAADPAIAEKGPDGAPQESAAYKNLTSMLSSLHLRGGAEKIHLKPYTAASTILPPWKDVPGKTTLTSLLGASAKHTAPTEAERRELVTVLGEVNSVNELHAYCSARRAAGKDAFVFLMHNQETNCSAHFMKHIAVEDYFLEPFLHDIVNSFAVEFPSICVLALLNGYAACGGDFEDGAYDTNIWWANCEHVTRVPAIDKEELLKKATVSYAAATSAGRTAIHNFLFGNLKDVSVAGKSASDRVKFANRCAYNLHSGSKPTDQSVRIVDGVEVPFESHCSRSEYRFSLIDILSGLHDDNVLYNRRYNLPSLASEMYLQDFSRKNSHKCF